MSHLSNKMTNRMNVLLTFVRRQHQNRSKAWEKDAVRYGYIKYYPRNRNEVDPSITPAKIFMVNRVKPFKGNPWWEKEMLAQIGFEEQKNDPVFVKNTPEMCSILWRIKHLIKIVPLKLPEKLPDMDDHTQTYFDHKGNFHVLGKLDPSRYKATEEARNSPKRLENATISEKLRLQWLKGSLI